MTDDLDARIENWRICFKDRQQYKTTGSLEGNYKEPPVTKEMLELIGNQTFEVQARAKVALDINDAIKVEKAVINLPDKHKKVFVTQVMYPYLLINSRFYKTCQIIGISRKEEVFNDYLKDAKIMLHNLLHKF